MVFWLNDPFHATQVGGLCLVFARVDRWWTDSAHAEAVKPQFAEAHDLVSPA
jgi:hypothetical protein